MTDFNSEIYKKEMETKADKHSLEYFTNYKKVLCDNFNKAQTVDEVITCFDKIIQNLEARGVTLN